MTFNEMVTEAELLYESLNSSDAPGFTNEEWGQLFTVAQRKVVVKILEEGVEKNAFNQLAIEKLIQNTTYLAASFDTDDHFLNSNNTVATRLDVVFNTKFFWILDEYVITATGTNIPLKRITYDFYRVNIKNPFRIPSNVEGFWVLQYNNNPVFITDGTAITEYHIIGVEHPDGYPDSYPIVSGVVYPTAGGTQASCLNPSVHPRIVEEAVTLARMSVNDAQGYQLAMAEFNK
jgi:hypothetical protein